MKIVKKYLGFKDAAKLGHAYKNKWDFKQHLFKFGNF